VAVVGNGTPEPGRDALAEEIGRRLAEAGAVVVCGGLGGVMAAACRGAASAGGLSVGLLPGTDRREADPAVGVAVATGMGELRNGIIVRTADVVIAVGGEYGTLSEVALALKLGRPVVGVGTWGLVRPDGTAESEMVRAHDARAAVELALGLAGR
jgi:uncharacterized protein (TIGR00725 family)